MTSAQHGYVPLRDTDIHANSEHAIPRVLRDIFCNQLILHLWKAKLAMVAHFAVGYLYYHTYMGWSFLDCVYFSTTVLMTVGYGDLIPTGDGPYVFTCLYILSGLVITASAISELVETGIAARISTALEGAAQTKVENVKDDLRKGSTVFFTHTSHSSGVGIFDKRGLRRKKLDNFAWALAAYVFWIMLGTMYYKTQDEFYDSSDTAWVRALYFSIVTLTTVGFGDLVARSDEDKIFDVVFMLVGIPLFARALASFTMIRWSDDDEEMQLNFVIGLNKEKLDSMRDFERELARKGYGNKVDGDISRFEFLAFILVRNDVVSMELLQDIMSNFDQLDKTKSGVISVADL